MRKISRIFASIADPHLWLATIALLSCTRVSAADGPAISPTASPPVAATGNVPMSESGTPLHPDLSRGLHFAPEPPNGWTVALAAVQRLVRRGNAAGAPDNAISLPLYRSAQPITQGDLDTTATLSSYYYLIKSGDKLVNTLTLDVDRTTGALSLNGGVGISPSTFILDALDTLAKSEIVQAGSYEPRMLRYGSSGPYGTLVLWLKSAPGGTDLIYFMQAYNGPPAPGLEPSKLFTLKEYVDSLRAKQDSGLAIVDARIASDAGSPAPAPFGASFPTPAVVSYHSLTNLGTLGGNNSAANAINDAGQVVGWGEITNGHMHAFLYSASQMLDLGALAGDVSAASAINASGQVVGWSELGPDRSSSIPPVTSPRGTPPIGTIFHGFVSDGGAVRDNGLIGFGASGGPQWSLGAATGINNSNQLIENIGTIASVGFEITLPWTGMPDLAKHAAGYALLHRGNGGVNIFYGKVRNDSWGSVACALNDAGQVVGAAALDAGAPQSSPFAHAYLYDGKEIKSLGTLGGDNSVALGINNRGLVVGWAEIAGTAGRAGNPHAFLFYGGKMEDLRTLKNGAVSEAKAINDAGQIVGMASVADGTFHAFIYTGGIMHDLNEVVGKTVLTGVNLQVLTCANGINNHGQIVGVAKDSKGNDVAYLLTLAPTAGPPAPASATATSPAVTPTATVASPPPKTTVPAAP